MMSNTVYGILFYSVVGLAAFFARDYRLQYQANLQAATVSVAQNP